MPAATLARLSAWGSAASASSAATRLPTKAGQLQSTAWGWCRQEMRRYVADRLVLGEPREDHGCHRITTEFSQESHSVCSGDET